MDILLEIYAFSFFAVFTIFHRYCTMWRSQSYTGIIRKLNSRTPLLACRQSTLASVSEVVDTSTITTANEIDESTELSLNTQRGTPEAHFGQKRRSNSAIPEKLSSAIARLLVGKY
jgi:hypothetical protein